MVICIDKIPIKEVLMIHKYFTFAVKRITVIMYNEQIDKVSADMLKEVNDKDEDIKAEPKVVYKNKEKTAKVVVANKKKDRLKDGNYYSFY